MPPKRETSPSGPARRFLRRVQSAARNWSDHNSSMMSAALAYYATCSLFPAVLLLISILGVADRLSETVDNAQKQFLAVVSSETSEAVADHFRSTLENIQAGASVGGPLGGVLLIVAALSIFANLEMAFDRIFGTEQPAQPGIWAAVRTILFRRFRAFLMLMSVGFFVLVLLLGGLISSAIYRYTDFLAGASYLWKVLQIAVTIALNGLLFTFLYKFLPRRPIGWRDAFRGGALVSLLWEISRHVLAVVLLSKKYSAYGVVGSLLALILWLYVSNAILLLGAEYVRVLRDERETKLDPEE